LGGQVSWVEGKKVPLIVQKSDGGFGYASTDLAAVRHRVETEKAEWVIYVTDVGQAEHFEMVFATARKAGWLPTDPKATPKVRTGCILYFIFFFIYFSIT
jgi:arginyl-tRNA synthetase